MEKKKTLSLSGVWLTTGAVIMVITALSMISICPAQAKESKKSTKSQAVRKCTMKDMDKCMAGCMKKCQANMEDVAAAKAAIKAAIEAIDAGNAATAKVEMEKADKLLSNVHKCMKENMQQMPCSNTKCPIEGKSIDRMDCPKKLTCMYKGSKVGFCCAGCPAEWDKLTDEEKDAKLKDVTPSME